MESDDKEQSEPFLKTCTEGFRFLRRHTVLKRLILFMTCVNFLAKMGNDGLLSPFVLARTGDDQRVLGLVQSFTALGVMAGSLMVTWMKPVKDRLKLIGISTVLVFSGNIFQGLSRHPAVWCAAAFASYAMAAVMNAHMTAFMREQIPLELQGRVFSAESTLKNCAIPLGLYLGGLLADRVFEPLMRSESPLRRWLAPFLGVGRGAGIAVQFVTMGVLGILLCLIWLKMSDDTRT